MPAVRLTDRDPMPWGKYKGVPMEEVPASYLDWLMGELETRKTMDAVSRAVFRYIRDNIAVIQADLGS